MTRQFVIDINGHKRYLSAIGNFRLIPHSDWIEVEELDSGDCVNESYVLHQEST